MNFLASEEDRIASGTIRATNRLPWSRLNHVRRTAVSRHLQNRFHDFLLGRTAIVSGENMRTQLRRRVRYDAGRDSAKFTRFLRQYIAVIEPAIDEIHKQFAEFRIPGSLRTVQAAENCRVQQQDRKAEDFG